MSEPPDRREILDYNRVAWDRQVERGNVWTVPVGPEEVARARQGDVLGRYIPSFIATRALKPRTA